MDKLSPAFRKTLSLETARLDRARDESAPKDVLDVMVGNLSSVAVLADAVGRDAFEDALLDPDKSERPAVKILVEMVTRALVQQGDLGFETMPREERGLRRELVRQLEASGVHTRRVDVLIDGSWKTLYSAILDGDPLSQKQLVDAGLDLNLAGRIPNILQSGNLDSLARE